MYLICMLYFPHCCTGHVALPLLIVLTSLHAAHLFTVSYIVIHLHCNFPHLYYAISLLSLSITRCNKAPESCTVSVHVARMSIKHIVLSIIRAKKKKTKPRKPSLGHLTKKTKSVTKIFWLLLFFLINRSWNVFYHVHWVLLWYVMRLSVVLAVCLCNTMLGQKPKDTN